MSDLRKRRMTILFDEWAKRISENPDDFMASMEDETGNPRKDYGELCASYIQELESELDAAGLLPKE